MKILLAVDGSACSERAVEEVARNPWPKGSEVKIISVLEMPVLPVMEPYGVPPEYFAELEDAARKHAYSVLDAARLKLEGGEDHTLRITAEVLPGSPRQAILDEADEWGADLIVMGSHGYGSLKRFLLGSVSGAVMSHAKCSVEVVRPTGL